MNKLITRFSILMFEAFPMDVQLFWLQHNHPELRKRRVYYYA